MKTDRSVALIESFAYDEAGDQRKVKALVWADHPATTSGHSFESLVPESLLIKAEKQLSETNRQLQTGLSIGGRQFYGTKEDIQWLQDTMTSGSGEG